MATYPLPGIMIVPVSFERTTYAPLPNRFEAGTPDIAGAIGLGAAIDYLTAIGFDRIAAYEHELLEYATQRIEQVPGLRIVGTAEHKAAVISFVIDSPPIAALDIATRLSNAGIAVRTGHHCCMPLMSALDIPGTCRASMAMYNTRADIDRLVETLQEIVAAHSARDTVAVTAASDESSAIAFAAASRPTIAAAAEELIEEFSWYDNKIKWLMELGEALPDTFAPLKSLTTQVPGCMSEVYLIGRPVPDAPDKFEFVADSNAQIVRGLIALLQALFSGQLASDVLSFDIEALFRKIGLDQFVSSQRRSGLDGMIRRIRTLAQAIEDRQQEN